MTSGYVLTNDGTSALACFSDERVRFAASLDDTSGIVAFDGEPDPAWNAIGTVFVPHPVPFCPKRAVATGREFYSVLPVLFEDYVASLRAVTGYVRLTDALLLVESDGPIASGADWSAGVTELRDKRLELANA
jgi:hypothetical protein